MAKAIKKQSSNSSTPIKKEIPEIKISDKKKVSISSGPKIPVKIISEPKFITEQAIPSVLITADQGSIEIRRVEEISGELLINPHTKTKNKKIPDIIYTGWNPTQIVLHANIFPRWFQKLLGKPRLRLKGWFNLRHEPVTRNPFTGEILEPIKKRSTLIERGIIDIDGFLLDKKGERLEYLSHWLKVDVSDIDFIKNEFHAYFQSEADVKAASAMKRTGSSIDDMWKWILIAAFICIAFIVFTLSGGF